MVGLVLLTAMLTGAVTEAEYIDGGLLQKIFLLCFFHIYIYTLIFGPFPNSGFTIATTCSEDTFGSL